MGAWAMASEVMEALLKLPSKERADLAMALWESLDATDREAAVELTPELAAELDRRLAEHLADPSTAIPWEEVRKKFSSGR
jgi:putative addiction module component (TIGR02574 family)